MEKLLKLKISSIVHNYFGTRMAYNNSTQHMYVRNNTTQHTHVAMQGSAIYYWPIIIIKDSFLIKVEFSFTMQMLINS